MVVAKASHAHRAMVPHLHDATALRAHPAWKVRVAVVVMGKEKHVLTTVVTVKTVHLHAAHALRVVARPVARKVARTVVAKMAMSCHATLIRSRPHSLRVWICPTANPCATAVSPIPHAPASTVWPAVAAVMVVEVVGAMVAATGVAREAAAVALAADQRDALCTEPA